MVLLYRNLLDDLKEIGRKYVRLLLDMFVCHIRVASLKCCGFHRC